MSIILASASPRRKQLLEQVGCKFSVITSDVNEDNQLSMPPHQLAVYHARAKASAVAGLAGCNDVVIGADTIVVVDGQVFGKPNDDFTARQMLTKLAGRSHFVITGLAVVGNGRVWTDFARTEVTIQELTAAQIDRYIATGEPLDKAGAYAIQGLGALLVERIEGCYTNVVGLPLSNLARLLTKAGIELL